MDVDVDVHVNDHVVEHGGPLSESYQRYQRALQGERLPAALVDLDAFDANLQTLLAAARGKALRLATKSVRSPDLLRRALGGGARGLMTYSAAETSFLADQGFADLLLAYPTAQAADAGLLAAVAARGALAGAVVDSVEQLQLLEIAAVRAGCPLPLIIDVDVSYRAASLHLGVRRSPLRTPGQVVALARRIADSGQLSFAGLLAYEAQIAGVQDGSAALRLLKRLSRPDVARSRGAIATALAGQGMAPKIFNGGGTGSLDSSSADPSLTELAAGSGLLAGHLFDGYRGLALRPALYFALAVTRRPAPGIVTCHGGGWVASGAAGSDRLPRPALPAGLQLLPREGAGEVQTPLRVPAGVELGLGSPVFFRPAKSGELAEHFAEYLLVQGERVVARAPTYRGLGQAFLG